MLEAQGVRWQPLLLMQQTAVVIILCGFLLSGNYNTGGAYNLGVGGNYWSRTAGSAQYGYRLYLSTSGVYPTYNDTKYLGLTVRCVLQP